MSFYPVVLGLYSGLMEVYSPRVKIESSSSTDSKMSTITREKILDADPITKFMLCQDMISLTVFVYGLLTLAKFLTIYDISNDEKTNAQIYNGLLIFIATLIGHTIITAITYAFLKKRRGFLLVFIIWNTTYKGIIFGFLMASIKDIYNYFCSSTSLAKDYTVVLFAITFIFGFMGLESYRTILLVNGYNKMKPKKNKNVNVPTA